MNPEQIETEYFDPDYKELSNKDRLGTVEGELLRIQDELEELKKKQRDMEYLYDYLKKK